MNNDILLKILQLDSLVRFLDWSERIRIHLYRGEKFNSTTLRIQAAYEWIIKENWNPPTMMYGVDRFQYFHDPELDLWVETENYLNYFPEYIQELNKLKF
ncbi:hypothetical protein HNP38_002740 [Chryseobacterium defluvii]|uniref:Uncharacterized protein n=1 Tax=Chryseobacterium defluvii TaxID=160396 RepID=A0A840KIC3_9FLAO|nr:hypothetical protein [Chryseobacterium defluvii]MBB4807434.1 hypothetical protein [Chryseobacterium defluvii]